MSNLFASLNSSAGALGAYQQALNVIQNNVNNASTPGYARQQMQLESLPFDASNNLTGGVAAGEVQSTRNRWADQEVRQQVQDLGYFDQKASIVQPLENAFDISGEDGIAGHLDRLFASFSAWSADPASGASRQAVLDQAQALSASFQQTAQRLSEASISARQQTGSTMQSINTLAAKIQGYNAERLRTGRADAGLDAQLQSSLEQLADLVNFSAHQEADGTVTVLVGGQSPLVISDRAYLISPPDATADGVRVETADGRDITAQVTGGRLGALLDFQNRLLPSTQSQLDRLAKGLADAMNEVLTSGRISDGPPPEEGKPLFTYDGTDGASAAATLNLDSDITADQLPAIDPGPPYVSNGVALRLADLGTANGQVDDLSFSGYFGQIAGQIGKEAAGATEDKSTHQQLLAQARSLRDQISGVSLDQEAVHLIEFQRAYQATAQMVSVLNELTQTTIDLLR